MVFNRKPDPAPAEMPSLKRANERATASHLSQVPVPPMPGMTADSVIGNDLSIEGQSITIRCKGSLRVNGNIQADLHSRAIEVGREAQISGAVAADTVHVYGKVSGAILGAKVVLHASAEVDGDIHSGLLSIEQGATFDGRSRKVMNPADIAPQLESPAAHATSAGPVTHVPYPTSHAEPKPSGPQPFGAVRPAEGFVN